MKILFNLNDAPYGSEKAYNALRLANELGKNHPEVEVRIFLSTDAVGCAVAGQGTPNGFYNIERMLKLALTKKVRINICTTCADARAIKESMLIEGIKMSSISELGDWVVECDKVLVF
ncbi:MAG: DsrE/DsrF/TusD sulfur relay family protein [Candidatus Kapaibacterium sp.]